MITMSNIKILIVEDEELYSTEVEMIVYRLGFEKIHVTTNSEEALHMVKIMEPDLIIMDINIDGELNGVEVAERIKDKEIPILFMTSMTDKDLYERAKKTPYVGYLIKPFDQLTMQAAIEFALNSLAQKNLKQEEYQGWNEDVVLKDSLLIKKSTSFLKLPVKDITYLQSQGNYCMIHTYDEAKHLINLSLVKIVQKLPSKSFMRVHKQYIVNLNFVKDITLGVSQINVMDTEIPVGRSYKSDLMARFDVLS